MLFFGVCFVRKNSFNGTVNIWNLMFMRCMYSNKRRGPRSVIRVRPLISAFPLAFEEMRTPYASGREICVQKLRNAYQRKEIAKRMTHFKSTGHRVKQMIQRNKSETMLAFLSQYPFALRDRLPHVDTEFRVRCTHHVCGFAYSWVR